MPLTKEEIEKIEEEERIRAEARNKYSQKPKSIPNKKELTRTPVFIFILLMIFVFMLLAGAGGFSIVPPIAIFIYFIPSVLAYEKRKNNATAILMLNLLLGWTVVGWVIALVWATIKD